MFSKWNFYFAALAAVVLSTCKPNPTLTVAGEFYHYTDAETMDIIGDLVCFAPDKASAKELPPATGIQDLWFCFDSTPHARKAFDIPEQSNKTICKYSGAATVRISGYQPAKTEGDAGWNSARLDAVLTKEPPKAIPCKRR